MDNEERALAKLDTAALTEFPKASSPLADGRSIMGKSFIICTLQVFAFYAPILDSCASDRKLPYFAEVQDHASSFERGCWDTLYGLGRAGPRSARGHTGVHMSILR